MTVCNTVDLILCYGRHKQNSGVDRRLDVHLILFNSIFSLFWLIKESF